MAFPTVADTTSGTVTGNTDPWTTPTYPANIAADDLLIALVATDGNGNPGAGFPADWIGATVAGGQPVSLGYAKRKCTGSESGAFNIDLAASEQGAWWIGRIPAAEWEGTLGTTWGNTSTAGSVQSGPGTDGTSTTPAPPSLNPSEWGVEDTLWIAAMAADTSRTVSDYPDGTTDNAALVSGGSGGATLARCRLESAVASWAPTTFTISSSDDWQAITIAIRPAAAVVVDRYAGFVGATVVADSVRRAASRFRSFRRHDRLFVPDWMPRAA